MGLLVRVVFKWLMYSCCFLVVSSRMNITGTKCGLLTCNTTQYCSLHDDSCRPCAHICDRNDLLFEEKNCVDNCQNYLHDLHVEEKLEKVKSEVQSLRSTVSLMVVLICLIFVILGVCFMVTVFQWMKKQQVTLTWIRNKLKPKEKPMHERSTTVPNTISGRGELRLDMPSTNLSTPTANGMTPSTATTTLSRRPTEDTTLDYAYDNPVIMIGTPSPNPPPHESSL